MKKWATMVAVVAIVAAAVGIGHMQYGIYQDNKVIDAAKPAVKNASLRLANALKLMQSENATYQELFAQMNANVSQIGSKLLEVQTAATPRTAVWMDAIGAYLTAAQELLRAEAALFRRRLQVSTALDLALQANNRLGQATDTFEMNYRRRASDDAITEARRRVGDLQNARRDLDRAFTKLAQARDRLTSFVPTDALIDPALLKSARMQAQRLAQ